MILCGRAEQSPAPTGWGCKREIQGNKKGDIKKQKGGCKRKSGKREKKGKTGSIGNHKRKRSFLGKA